MKVHSQRRLVDWLGLTALSTQIRPFHTMTKLNKLNSQKSNTISRTYYQNVAKMVGANLHDTDDNDICNSANSQE